MENIEAATTRELLRNKIVKILSLLLLIRLGLYIPIPKVDLDILSQSGNVNSIFGFAKNLTGSSFLGLGSLGILPYINASIVIQLLTPVIPALEKLQKEEGELGREQITKYTRYLTFVWALAISTGVAFALVKPVTFNWDLRVALEVILSLTTGSMLSMWFAELITEEKLGNGSSMIIFINIIGGIPAELNKTQFFANESSFLNNLVTTGESLLIYFFIVLIVIVFQEAYKRIDIISAKQLSFTNSNQSQDLSELKSSFIPLKINLGGIMPLVFSSTVSAILVYPVQALFATIASAGILSQVVPFYSFALNVTLIVFFSCFYAVIVLKPGDISQNLAKSAYTIPGVRQGDTTTKYLEQTINRLSFMGGLFLAFLAFSPLVIGNLFQLRLFRNITSLLILIGVITDVTSQIQGYLVSQKYETFKKAS